MPNAGSGHQAFVEHDPVTVTAPADSNALTIGNSSSGLVRVDTGGALEIGSLGLGFGSSSGVLEMLAGTINCFGPMSVGNSASGTFIADGGSFTGSGQIDVGFSSPGTLEFVDNDPTFTVSNGNLIFGSNGTLKLPFAGNPVAFPVINVNNGNVQLNNGWTIDVGPTIGEPLMIGQSWDVINYSGTIVLLNTPNIVAPPDYDFTIDTTSPNVIRLVVTQVPLPDGVPAVSEWGLIVLGGLFVIGVAVFVRRTLA